MLNSEFGNVWGYEGSTGDVDWSWDYHRAVDAFRRHPKLAGWLYTEHHDVINEWNGYWRFDRSAKETGFGELVPGMTLRDLHSPLYLAVGDPELSTTVRPGETSAGAALRVVSHGQHGVRRFAHASRRAARLEHARRAAELRDDRPAHCRIVRGCRRRSRRCRSTMPNEPAVAVLAVRLEDASGYGAPSQLHDVRRRG